MEPVPFKGTYREAGWQRCGAMSAADGITFTPWPHATMPNWSMPALEAAKCVARQGDDLFERARSIALTFWDAYLKNDAKAKERLTGGQFGSSVVVEKK